MDFDAVTRLGWPGWVELRLRGEDSPPRVLARVEERDGRLVVTRLILLGDQLDSSTLRAVPVGRIEAALVHLGPQFREAIFTKMSPAVAEQMEREKEMFPKAMRAVDRGLDAFLAGVEHRTEVVPREVPARKPLTRPDGTDPDGFAQRVAHAYASVVSHTAAPAKLLAEEAGVPVVTVHRWIADARRRGHLPPARQGRAG